MLQQTLESKLNTIDIFRSEVAKAPIEVLRKASILLSFDYSGSGIEPENLKNAEAIIQSELRERCK